MLIDGAAFIQYCRQMSMEVRCAFVDSFARLAEMRTIVHFDFTPPRCPSTVVTITTNHARSTYATMSIVTD